MKNNVKDYYLGLDIGTNSVGWAATNENYQLCKFRKKELWGIRLFENGDTAAERRTNRNTRRRLDRRKQRIKLLQMLFANEIAKVDETFFIRLNESRLHTEDKSTNFKFPLFVSSDYTERDYYKEYPTIYHLRKELIEKPNPHDIRLVYLALHHIVKNRGHFLIDGDLNAATDFEVSFNQMVENMNHSENDSFPFDLSICEDGVSRAKEILESKDAKSNRAKALGNLFAYPEFDADKNELKQRKTAVEQICKLLVGNKGDVTKIFYRTDFSESELSSFAFGSADYEEKILPELESNYPDEAPIVQNMKMLYDWSKLSEILGNSKFLSFAKVSQYNKHKSNLQNIKKLILKYLPKEDYDKIFKSMEKNSYAHYVGKVTFPDSACDEESFYKNLQKYIDKVSPDNEQDTKLKETTLEEIQNRTLLPLQRGKGNSVIPRQVNEAELKEILNNAEKYLPFLKEKDDSGISTSEKIVSLFNFRVPYYIGPLSDRHRAEGANQWMVRKKDGKIYPWNFTEMVDERASNEQFIARMTNKCTYLPEEDVLPKNSLLYSRFMVLNELNNLRVRGHKIPVALKQDIYHNLFEKKNRVTGKSLLEYLQKDDASLRMEDLSGFDKDFKAQLKAYKDFEKQVFGARIAEEPVQKIVEDIIRWSTIYDKDSKMIRRAIEENYGEQLTPEKIKQVIKLHYSGWGNLSYKFLNGIEGVKKDTGEIFTIIRALWETNDNLMEILSSDYTFQDEINKMNAAVTGEISEISYDSLVKNLYVSPAIKRAIWQTIQITEEIQKVQGGAPKKIFVEMARGGEKDKKNGEKGSVPASRKKRLLDLYEKCESDTRDWVKEIDNREEREFSSIKLFLYYTQMGKDMYTGEPIDIEQLMNGNSNWDRDHIYPQSKIKDDSLDNLVLVNKKTNNEKQNAALSPEIQKKMKPFWKQLHDKHFISDKKYARLTRTGEFSEEELSGFIARQLVETRQSTKAIANLLQKIYTDSEIVYVKARLASNFRHDDLAMLKSRRVNDYHHAKDAYLNIVVGNVYNSIFTSDPKRWLKEGGENAKTYNIQKIFRRNWNRDEKTIWEGPTLIEDENTKKKKYLRNEDGGLMGGTIDTVRKTMMQNNILYTEYTYCDSGQLYNATVYKKGDTSLTIPLKKGLSIEKYGGYKSANTSYFAMIEYDGKKGRERMILGVPIYVDNMLKHNPDAFIEYCENVKGYKNVKILRAKIKKNALISVNGFPMRIRGENERDLQLKNNLQLKLLTPFEKCVRNIEKYLEKNASFEVDEERDGLSDDELNNLYDCFLTKLETIYKNRPANQSKLMREKEMFFKDELSLKEKSKCLNEILNMLRCDIATTANLDILGKGKTTGNIAINKNTFSNKSELKFINQSVTGIFVNEEEL